MIKPGKTKPIEITESLLSEVERGFYPSNESFPFSKVPKGYVYTPPKIVNFILDSVGYVAKNNIENSYIIDLSSGTGSFIREIAKRLRQRLISIGYNPEKYSDAKEMINILVEHIYATDINTISATITAKTFLFEIIQEIATIRERVNGFVPPFLNIYQADSLHPQTKFGIDHFDYIVGNPPYVRNKEIDEKADRVYRGNYRTAKGKYDLYCLFFEKGLNILKEDGKMGLITSNRFFWTDYGTELRDVIRKRSKIISIVDLQTAEPFPSTNIYPSILILKKKSGLFPISAKDDSYTYIKSDMAALEKISVTSTEKSLIYKQSQLSSKPWHFLPHNLRSLKSTVQKNLPRMKDIPIKIRAGLATGSDNVFIFRGKPDDIEDDLLVPIIRGRNIHKGYFVWDNEYLLNPYIRDSTTLKAKTIDLESYSKAQKYLLRHKELLTKKYHVAKGRKKWYETHDTVFFKTASEKRIVTPDITNKSKFAIAEGYICHNSCYSLYYLGDLNSLLAYFNSEIFEFLLKSSLPEIGSGYWRQMKRYLEVLPVINPRSINESIRDELQQFVSQKKWERIDDLFYDLLDIKPAVRNEILNYLGK